MHKAPHNGRQRKGILRGVLAGFPADIYMTRSQKAKAKAIASFRCVVE